LITSFHFALVLSSSRLARLVTASWVLHPEIQRIRTNCHKHHSAEGTRHVAVVHIVTAAFLPAVFTVFAHGALLAFGGSLADSVFRVNARTSFQNPHRKCPAPGHDAGPSNHETGNRLCRSGGRPRSRQ